ncbi:MAG: BatA domain-containing protein [Candidatus Nealsonbacteria bacterium]|nr:BatA domain-containing protein [Candidatus Nealsonbacteria bacterium]
MSLPFLVPMFLLAGAIAAAGPVVIHLLNRRRYKVVHWAAMDFLREAVFRSRRIMQLRDLLLMLLRTLCILAFGAALAQPFLGSSVGLVDQNQPTHAVLLVDNSLSMGYKEFDKLLLDKAKAAGKELIDGLPRGSRISVLPVCGSAEGFSYDAYFTKDDAREALDAIGPVDRSALAAETIDLALEACRRVPDMPAKKIYLLTDRQVSDWPVRSLGDHLQQLPGPINVIEVEPAAVANVWISDFKLQDAVADLQTPTVFVATVHFETNSQQRDPREVQLELTVDGEDVASRTVELLPGQKRQVEFPPHLFTTVPSSGKAAFVTAEVSIVAQRENDEARMTNDEGRSEEAGLRHSSSDQGVRDGIEADNHRFAVVPVVATLPVVFVDQCGSDEDPQQNFFGETYTLRRLLAPRTGRERQDPQLIDVKHLKIDQLQRDVLEDARLVVIAGVEDPQSAVPLLRQYVQQGGNLLIAAGGNFSPGAWTDAAWADGLGILPAPLNPIAVGRLPEQSPETPEWFHLDYQSMENHEFFQAENTSREKLQDLLRGPYFFKTIEALADDEHNAALVDATTKQIQQQRVDLAKLDRQLAELDQLESSGTLSAADRSRREDLRRRRATIRPNWLLWGDLENEEQDERPVEELAAATESSVLARYTNGLPFMVERRIGRGRVLLVTSGIHPGWNTLATDPGAMWIYDRIFRSMLHETLPERNLSSQQQFVLPVAAARRGARFTLARPDGRIETMTVDAIGANRYAVNIGNLTERGHYKLTVTRGSNSQQQGLDPVLQVVQLAVNGPADESRLVAPARSDVKPGANSTGGSLEDAQAFSIGNFQRAQLHGTDLWKLAILFVMACLLLELIVLAWPSRSSPASVTEQTR